MRAHNKCVQKTEVTLISRRLQSPINADHYLPDICNFQTWLTKEKRERIPGHTIIR